MGITTADVNIDKNINPYLPPNRIYRLPGPVAYILGHRDKPRKEIGNVLVAFWALVGAFVGVVAMSGAFMIPSIRAYNPPILIASFVRTHPMPSNSPPPLTFRKQGAACILEYNTIESPLAQPRNSILGHILSTIIGVGITKLFKLSPSYESLRWVAGALACGVASGSMTLTKTIYPPAGATALLAAVDPQVEELGWYLLPLVLLSSVIILITSLLINNIQRKYPTYWWTPVAISRGKDTDIEKLPPASDSETSVVEEQVDESLKHEPGSEMIRITQDRIIIPSHVYLAAEEKGMLEILRGRLGTGTGTPRLSVPSVAHSRQHSRHPSQAKTQVVTLKGFAK